MNDQIDFDFGRPPSGRTCPDTSYLAAKYFEEKAVSLRAQVFRYIHQAGSTGATAYEVFEWFGLDKNKTSPRISELKREGLVFDTGERRKVPGECGSSVVWRSTRL